ncbi:hypothetical protein F4819DRAFT_506264 [Hypoxylon fuscum]|nr:hypothetical protein F4819DRAFT_506264 [Hypoxylon fuscum]
MATTPERRTASKRKADEIAVDENEQAKTVKASEEPAPKKAKTEHTEDGPVETVELVQMKLPDHCPKRWNVGIEMPKGKPRPKFTGDSESKRKSGEGTVGDPMITWVGTIPSDAEIRTANEGFACRAAKSLKKVTHVYIRCATQSSMFVDRDGKRIPIWNPDTIQFHHRTVEADPHMCLAFGTEARNLVLYGYVHVVIDESGKPTGFATVRNDNKLVDGDDRIFELFEYDAQQNDCAPYCPSHASSAVLIDTCKFAQPRCCPLHNTEGLLDHWCRRTRWKTEVYGDHYCPCPHSLIDLMDHYCPCPHDQVRRTEESENTP